ncbi:methyl-accepting chemotaxis protein [Paenibacillus thailandensis]|uniref:Methyl-accepting chemotaxis protein n=1 Tax=Paenibacillus thailandensis TaxID=393250 RepID=A0ABW5QWB5_9BACL
MRLRKFNLTVSQRLTASFLVILVILAANGIISFTQMGKMNENAAKISGIWLLNTQAILELNHANENLLTIQYKMIYQKDTPAQMESLKSQGEAAIAELEQIFASYRTGYTKTDDSRLYESLKSQWSIYIEGYNHLVDVLDSKGDDRQIDTAIRDSENSFNALSTYTDALIWQNQSGASDESASSRRIYNQSAIVSGIGIGVAVALIAGLLFYIRRTISVPLKKASETVRLVSEGDLQVTVPKVRTRDEIAVLMDALSGMIAMMQGAVGRMQAASAGISASAQELLAVSQENASSAEEAASLVREAAAGASEQLVSFGEIARSTEEMSTGVQRIAESSSIVSQISAEAAERSKEGAGTIEDAVRTMNAIDESIRGAAQQVEQLESHMQSIGNIINLIGNISKQTNLLALNASIEAARAGEHGKGFAVVAEEVRQLSGQTAKAVSEITETITKIKDDTLQTAASMHASREESGKGISKINEAGAAFRRIADASDDVSAKIQEVAAAAEQLAASSEQVAASVEQVMDIARRTSDISGHVAAASDKQAAAAGGIASSAGSLSEIALDMNEVVSRFKL